MNLSELINTTSWQEVRPIIIEVYPEEMQNISIYERIFKELQTKKVVLSDIEIVFSFSFFDLEQDSVMVSGQKVNDNNSYALEYISWSDWLGMKLSEDVIQKFSPAEIISYCILEMTYVAFEEKLIKKQFKELLNRLDKIKSIPKEQKQKNILSLEEAVERIKKL